MSSQSDPTKGDLQGDNWRQRSSTKRPRRRPFIIEWRYSGQSKWMRRHHGEWKKWGGYETAKRRDYALLQKQKSSPSEFEYRAIDD